MVATRTAIDWPWSSVAAHVEGRHDALLTREPLVQRVGPAMRTFFDIDVGEEAQRKLRLASSTGRPAVHPVDEAIQDGDTGPQSSGPCMQTNRRHWTHRMTRPAKSNARSAARRYNGPNDRPFTTR